MLGLAATLIFGLSAYVANQFITQSQKNDQPISRKSAQSTTIHHTVGEDDEQSTTRAANEGQSSVTSQSSSTSDRESSEKLDSRKANITTATGAAEHVARADAKNNSGNRRYEAVGETATRYRVTVIEGNKTVATYRVEADGKITSSQGN